MRRLLIGIVLVGLTWSIPELRQRTWQPVLVRLGPVGARAMEPSRRAGARSNANHLLRTMLADHNQGRQIPDARGFEAWSKRRFRDPTVLVDPWGSNYYIERTGGQLTVISPGPDRKRNTADDIRASSPF
jgi:hypothetical protein